jgi:hypothetical protein
MTSQQLVLIRGLPGAGKTTYAKKHYPKHIYYDADMFCIDSNGKYNFVPELAYKSHDMCKTKIKESLQDGYNVVVANVFATKRDICGYISYISSNIKIDIIHINGMFQSIHNVPNHTINRIKSKWEQYPGETEIYFDNQLKKVDLPKDIIKNQRDVVMTELTDDVIEQKIIKAYKNTMGKIYVNRLRNLKNKVFANTNTSYIEILSNGYTSYNAIQNYFPNLETRKSIITAIIAAFKHGILFQDNGILVEKSKSDYEEWYTYLKKIMNLSV